MPNNILIFLRHAETKVTDKFVVSKWILTDKGKKVLIEIENAQTSN